MAENNETNSLSSASAAALPEKKKARTILVLVAVAFLIVIGGGLIWGFALGSQNPVGAGWYLFSFSMGLTMIVLPCTLPLAFVIVPLSMGKGPVKGFSIALAFGAGIVVMLSLYGVLAAVLGEVAIGTLGAPLEVVKNWLYLVAGVFAYVFALGELGLVRFRMPSFSGAAPMFIQKQSDVIKAFLLGLFLGNVGVGCPHPATPVILTRIAVSGDVFYGWLLFLVHAIGRIIPLLLLALLGILGINALQGLLRHKEKIERATGWVMVFVAAFILVLGLFTHDWWVYSGQHSLLEKVTQEERFTTLVANWLNVGRAHTHGTPTGAGLFGQPLWLGNWVLVALWIIPMWWHWKREKKKINVLPDADRPAQAAILRFEKWFTVSLSVLLALLFIQVIPHWFLSHKALETEIEESVPAVAMLLFKTPSSPRPEETATLTFYLKDDDGNPLEDLQIEHERILHAVIVHEDFSTFAHLHPEDFGLVTDRVLAEASFSVNYAFPKEGRYLVSVNVLHENHGVSKQFFVDVGARGTPTFRKDLSRVKEFGGYQVLFRPPPAGLRSRESASIWYRIEKDGKGVSDLEEYLGAPMHLAIISADLSYFLHTHGEIHDPQTRAEKHTVNASDKFGPEIEAHVTFPFPGIYQIFSQFSRQGESVLTSFMVEVGPGEAGSAVMESMEPHGH